MATVLVTGAKGFIGRNLVAALKQTGDYRLLLFDIDNTDRELEDYLAQADFIFHLAGVNRTENEKDFWTGNTELTRRICEILLDQGGCVPLLFSSSTRAGGDSGYAKSKAAAEYEIRQYSLSSGARVLIYRLPNVFGKWARPNYNSVVATFCYNIARDLPISISDQDHRVAFAYIDDVIQDFCGQIQRNERSYWFHLTNKGRLVSLGRLARLIFSFRKIRKTLVLPEFNDPFVRKLYGTYLFYLPTDDLAYYLDQHCDKRGCLAEFIKSPAFGQIFVSTTEPGVTRGGHYHNTKAEKFLVLSGVAMVRLRQIDGDDVIEFLVAGSAFKVADIPPGYTHSIENVGTGVLVTLFWASEVFDPERPDTYYASV